MAQEASKEIVTDVLVVGGGLAGLTLSAALGGAGLDVVCVDGEPRAKQISETFDGRTTAVAFGSRRVLEGAGIWRHLPADAAQPILDIRVADNFAPLFLHYDHREVGDPLGWIVENRHLRLAMLARVDELAGTVRHMAPAKVVDVTTDARAARVRVADGTAIRARLLVGADGARSFVRGRLGIETAGWSYPQTAIVCTVEHERPHHGVAVEHFLPAGPFAILPMTGNRASIVWTETSDAAPGYVALPEAAFDAELQRRFGGYLGDVHAIGPRFSYPLRAQLAQRYTAERAALVADAAHVIHPIAGQGLNLGIRDIAALAEAVVDAARLGLDVGSATALERYERWRRFDTLTMVAVTDSMNRLFSNDVGPVKLARDLGLAAVNKVPPLRRFFMRHAMGVVGTLPRLVRGEAL